MLAKKYTGMVLTQEFFGVDLWAGKFLRIKAYALQLNPSPSLFYVSRELLNIAASPQAAPDPGTGPSSPGTVR